MARMGALVFPAGRGSDRAVGGSVLTAALILTTVRVLGAIHRLTGDGLLGMLLVAVLVMAGWSRRTSSGVPIRTLATWATAPLLVGAAATLSVAIVSAVLLPVWQWDALGYHLPYVNFALVAHGFDGVPDDMPYVSTYPHTIETLIIALRALLPDDRLVDLAQIPFAIVGAIATAGIARRVGASRSVALAAGAAWILCPAVFLQMPTDYVDVASAAFLLAAIYFALSASSAQDAAALTVRKQLIVGGLALALYVGSKPNAPLSAALVAALFA